MTDDNPIDSSGASQLCKRLIMKGVHLDKPPDGEGLEERSHVSTAPPKF
jgi:hypothetical protein